MSDTTAVPGAANAASAIPIPSPVAAEPPTTRPGTSPLYDGGPSWRRFLRWYPVAQIAFLAVSAATTGVLLPNQIQSLVFGRYFTGADADVDIAALNDLKSAVDGGQTPTADQSRLLSLLADFDASRVQSLAIATTLALIGAMIVQPVVGVLSDRTRSPWGRRTPWIVVGALGAATFLVGLRFAPSVALLVICWPLALTFLSMAISAYMAVLADRVPENKLGLVSALSGIGSLFGGIVAAVFAGATFATLGLNIYLVLAVVVLVCVLGFAFRARDASSLELEPEPFAWGSFLKGFLVPLRDRDFRLVWAARVILYFGYTISTALGFFILQSYISPALSAAEATTTVPLLAVASLPLTLIGMGVAGWLSDKIGRRKPFVIAASLIMASSMIVPLVSATLPALFVQAAISGFAFGIYIPVDQALFVDVLPDKEAAGRDLGVASLATNLGQSLGPILAGQLVAVLGGYGVVYVSGLVLLLVSGLLVVPVRRVR